MTTDKKAKPEFTLLPNPSLDDLCKLYKDLTGKEVDPKEKENMRAILAGKQNAA